MAFDWFKEEEQGEDGPQQPMQQLGQQSPVVTGNTQPGVTAEGEKKSASGSFTNLNSYLDANKSHGFGKEVAGRVGATIDEADQAQGVADTAFRSSVDDASVAKDQNVINQVNTDPTKVDQGAFEKMRDATYKGPNTLSDTDIYQPVQQKTDRAFNTAEQTKDEGGRKAYLNQEYGAAQGRYDYSKGQQKLDNLLIQQDPDSKALFEQNQARGTATKNQFGNLSSALDNYAGQKKAGTLDARSSARGAIGIDDSGNFLGSSPVYGLQKSAKDRADKLNKDRDDEYEALKASLGSKSGRSLNDKALGEAGLSTGQQLFGYDFVADESGLVSKGIDLDRHSASTVDEQARAQALSKLAGKENTFLPFADKAGKYNPEDFASVDRNRLMAHLGGKQAEYNDELNRKDIFLQSGGFDPDTGASTGGGSYSMPEVLDMSDRLASLGAQGLYDDTSHLSRYQETLKKLQGLQERFGYGDTVGGGRAAGDWRDRNDYSDANNALRAKYGLPPL